MQAVSNAYKREMKKKYRDECSFLRVTIGMINQTAQASASVAEPKAFTYFRILQSLLIIIRWRSFMPAVTRTGLPWMAVCISCQE